MQRGKIETECKKLISNRKCKFFNDEIESVAKELHEYKKQFNIEDLKAIG